MTGPKVTIIAATEEDPVFAAALLIFTKSTRLRMSTGGLDGIRARCRKDWIWAEHELNYMAHTIRSSWEFLDITFVITDVSRACAQQMTRTRLASYAMQSQRVTNLTGATYYTPDELDSHDRAEYQAVMTRHIEDYEGAISANVKPENARGLLPMNVHCNLVAKYNLRALVDLVSARTSPRVQGEYRSIAEQMRDRVQIMWPWTESFFKPRNMLACEILDELGATLTAVAEPGTFTLSDDEIQRLRLLIAKAKDQIEGH